MSLNNILRLVLLPALLWALPLHADPHQDQTELRQYYRHLFPQLTLADYRNGVYAIDAVARESWQAIEEFPPYEPAIDQGEVLFNSPFANGKHYADCFPDPGIAHHYPQWNTAQGEVLTLPVAINACRIANWELPLAYPHNDLLNLQAFIAYRSRGKPIDTTVPENDPRALAAYQQGKAFYYQRRGQLNFACATCHIQNAGKKIRSETLSALLGHTANWPVYRLKWGELGSLHRRFAECLEQIRAQPLPEQSVELRNLEYFLSFMGQGIPVTGPSVRK
ncbi:MAG: sulfur oxidation c-type cytochrome SoxA [Methylovulum sp.]|nr:sulfur oxidation c-type cytochrome SoxA [Methylovulum sp.]